MSDQETFSSGELVQATGLSFQSIYKIVERLGLEVQKTPGGHARYTQSQARKILEAAERKKNPRERILGSQAAA